MTGTKTKRAEAYSKEETRERFEAALRGAREVGHKQMKDISPKRRVTKRAAKPKVKPAS
jgi:hypothetical protein